MMMESNEISSRDKLEQVFREGKITREDYERLVKAMIRPPEPEEEPEPSSRERGKLRKSWEDGVIGGLCAGYARYFGVDVNLVRILFVAVVILLTIFNGKGWTLILLYFSFCPFVSWDEKEKAVAFQKSGHPRLFSVAVATLFFILPLIYSVAVSAGLEELYEQMGMKIWSPQYQSTIAGRAIDCASEYRSILHQLFSSEWDHQLMALLVGTLVVWVCLFGGVIYDSLCKPHVRRGFVLITLGLGVAWMIFLVAGTVYPFVMGLQRIR